MTYKCTLRALGGGLGFLFFAFISLHGQNSNPVAAKQVQELMHKNDYTTLVALVDSTEASWKKAPSIEYFHDMYFIGDILIGGTTQEIYWLGRKALWNMLLKPTPNEYLSPQQFYQWKYTMFFEGAETITPYVDSLSPEMFASIRHDTFLMLSEYARQLHSTIIAGYRDKYTGGAAERNRFMQNAIDNEVQRTARRALSSLPTDHIQYLIDAYSHAPKDDAELKALLDILNVQGVDREKVMRDTR